MVFRKKSVYLLLSVTLLLVLAILDISFRKEELFESFGNQFGNEERTRAYIEAHRGSTSTEERHVEIAREGANELFFAHEDDSLTVVRSADAQTIRLHYTVTATGKDAEEADRRRDEITVGRELKQGRLSLAVSADGHPIDRDEVTVDYVLHVPDGLKLVLDNEEGLIDIDGLHADVEVSSERGIVEISGVQGNVKVGSNSEDLYMVGIVGNVELKNRYSDATVEQIRGDVIIDDRSGRTFVAGIEGAVSGQTTLGNVHLRSIDGDAMIEAQNAILELDGVSKNIRVRADSGQTKLILEDAAGYRLDAAANGGRIRTSLPFPTAYDPDETFETRMTGVAGDGTHTVDVKVSYGDVVIHTKKGLEANP